MNNLNFIVQFAAPFRLMTARALISLSLQQLVAADSPAGATSSLGFLSTIRNGFPLAS